MLQFYLFFIAVTVILANSLTKKIDLHFVSCNAIGERFVWRVLIGAKKRKRQEREERDKGKEQKT